MSPEVMLFLPGTHCSCWSNARETLAYSVHLIRSVLGFKICLQTKMIMSQDGTHQVWVYHVWTLDGCMFRCRPSWQATPGASGRGRSVGMAGAWIVGLPCAEGAFSCMPVHDFDWLGAAQCSVHCGHADSRYSYV